MATKEVQREDGDPCSFHIAYYGEHTCSQTNDKQPVRLTRPVPVTITDDQQSHTPTSQQSGLELSIPYDEVHKLRETKAPRTMKKSTPVRLQLVGNLDDGYSWRKYGQKEILGAKHPRSVA